MELPGGLREKPANPAPTQTTAQMLFLETMIIILPAVEVCDGVLSVFP